ncbi:MAG: hypothetical protein K6T83_13215, partial [Alicyclobacillus sp.]|nr:hypothetical protein [Alicyclobacillus sp.]
HPPATSLIACSASMLLFAAGWVFALNGRGFVQGGQLKNARGEDECGSVVNLDASSLFMD